MYNIYHQQYGRFVKVVAQRDNWGVAVLDGMKMETENRDGTYAVANADEVFNYESWKQYQAEARKNYDPEQGGWAFI
jgi:hypothetical protein